MHCWWRAQPVPVQGMRTVGPYVAAKLCEIVKLRNQLARKLGYEDFYDYKVSIIACPECTLVGTLYMSLMALAQHVKILPPTFVNSLHNPAGRDGTAMLTTNVLP